MSAIFSPDDDPRLDTNSGFGLPDANGWRPIETAPHNVPVLLYCPNLGITNPERIELGCASHGTSTANGSSYSCHGWATHWMPLPPFPVAA